MIVLLSESAQRWHLELPRPAFEKVAAALEALSVAPRSGVALPVDSQYRGSYRRVVRIRRRWSYQIIYDVLDGPGIVWVHLILSPWE